MKTLLALALTLATAAAVLAQDRPGALTAVENSTADAGVASIQSRSLTIGTNTAKATLPQIISTAPTSSVQSVAASNLTFVAVTASNVYIGRAGLIGAGTNWIVLTGGLLP